jgi:hypothetical protein
MYTQSATTQQNTKYKIQNTKYKIQNTKHKTQNTKHKTQTAGWDQTNRAVGGSRAEASDCRSSPDPCPDEER